MAAAVGCDVADGVTKGTTVLVIGDQDVRHLHGREKSAKHRKAEKMIREGAMLRIIGESDFRALVMSGASGDTASNAACPTRLPTFRPPSSASSRKQTPIQSPSSGPQIQNACSPLSDEGTKS
jgi:hypothetical protein